MRCPTCGKCFHSIPRCTQSLSSSFCGSCCRYIDALPQCKERPARMRKWRNVRKALRGRELCPALQQCGAHTKTTEGTCAYWFRTNHLFPNNESRRESTFILCEKKINVTGPIMFVFSWECLQADLITCVKSQTKLSVFSWQMSWQEVFYLSSGAQPQRKLARFPKINREVDDIICFNQNDEVNQKR